MGRGGGPAREATQRRELPDGARVVQTPSVVLPVENGMKLQRRPRGVFVQNGGRFD
jgi:hypothetical protein